jgi:hypothetical protein
MMGIIKKKLYYFLTNFNCDGIRSFLIISSYLWSILLFMPGYTFDKGTYNLMAFIASENVWAIAFLLYAILGTLNLEDLFDRKYTIVESIIGFLIWSTTAVCIFMSTSQAPAAAAPHIVGAFMSWWVLIRAGLKNV